MHKLSKRFLFAAAATLVALALVGVDCYSGSTGVRTWLADALSKELGVPVQVNGLHYSPWSGLVASGLSAKSPEGEEANRSSLNVPKISARVALWPLFSHRLVVKRLAFSEPTLVWVQNGDGAWSRPVHQRAVQTEALPSPTPAVSLPQEPKKARKPSQLEFNVQTVRIKNATVRFVDRKGATLGLLEGVSVNCPHGVLGQVEGSLSIRKATLSNGLALDELKTPFVFNGGCWTFPHLDAHLAQGSVRGEGKIVAASNHPAFTLDLLFDGVDINGLLTELGEDQTGSRTSGTLHGCLDLYGRIGKKKSMGGAGHAGIQSGRMEQFPLLQLIGKVLPIEELTNLELQQAQLDLRAGEGKVYVDSLVMESPNLSITAMGTSDFDGKLDLAAHLAVNPKISRQLPSSMDANFQPVPGSDRRSIAFNVTGTLSHPDTDLMRVLVGQKIENELMNVFRTLTGKPKKKPGEKKKPEMAAPSTEDGDEALEPPPIPQPSASPAASGS